MTHGFGWRPQPEDPRDRRFSAPRPGVRPPVVDRRHLVREIHNQGTENSCVGHAIAAAIGIRMQLDGKPYVRASAHGVYWPARAKDGFQFEDQGAYVRSGAKAVHGVGVPTEAEWPSRPETVNQRPPMVAEKSGIVRADGPYQRAYGAEAALDALVSGPVVFGIGVTNAFYYPVIGGVIPAPNPGDLIRGRHAIVAIGYEGGGERVLIANSWGIGWCEAGFAWIKPEWFDDPHTGDITVLMPREVANV